MNHETQRLLVAASRGARIISGDCFTLMVALHVHRPGGQRIHPEDVHLQYGPISSELRRIADEFAQNGTLRNCTDMTQAALVLADAYHWLDEVHTTPVRPFDIDYTPEVLMPWLYTFAAELAADAGM